MKDSYPIPLIEDCLDTFTGTKFFLILVMSNEYYQIMLDEDVIPMTVYITHYGVFFSMHSMD